MTANVATLHPARSPAAPRQRLAATIERVAEAQGRVNRIEAAQAKGRELASEKFRAVEAAEATLTDARQAEPRRLVGELLGDAPATGPTVAEADRALSEAHAARDALESARETLATEMAAAQDSLGIAVANRNSALSEVLRASAGLTGMLADFDDLRRRYASLRQVLRWLAGLPRDALSELQRASLDFHVDGWPADPAPILAQWQPAVAALEHDAGAPLPGDN
ncbi:MAG: hypothetical protein WB764_10635 [Xanthobacteraceae bacterium]